MFSFLSSAFGNLSLSVVDDFKLNRNGLFRLSIKLNLTPSFALGERQFVKKTFERAERYASTIELAVKST